MTLASSLSSPSQRTRAARLRCAKTLARAWSECIAQDLESIVIQPWDPRIGNAFLMVQLQQGMAVRERLLWRQHNALRVANGFIQLLRLC